MPFIIDLDLPLSCLSEQNNTVSIYIQSPATSPLSSISMVGNNVCTRQEFTAITSVAQALEIARESPEGSQNPTVVRILESALADIWRKIQAYPNSYVMTRDEFAVFNYFQDRFEGYELAVSAKRRYWDSCRPNNGYSS